MLNQKLVLGWFGGCAWGWGRGGYSGLKGIHSLPKKIVKAGISHEFRGDGFWFLPNDAVVNLPGNASGATGVAITFFGPSDEEAYHVLLKGYADAAAVAKAKEEDDDEEEDEREEEDVDEFLKPFERLPKEAAEALRYRAEDTLRSISKSAVKDARLRELRVELLNSERLASHFEENPDDLNLLRHDSSISKRDDANKHLSHLPAYLRNASKKKRKKNAINAVETEDGDEAKWAAMRLDVDVAEFGQKKKRRRKDKREGGKQKKTREEVGAKVKRKAGRKRSR